MQADLFSDSSRRDRIKAMALLMLVALAARLPAMLVSGGMGEAPHAGMPPLWIFWIAPLKWIASGLGLVGQGENVLYKLAGVAGDLGLIAMLFMILSRIAPDGPPRADEKVPPPWTGRSFWLAMVYSAHPLAVMTGAGLGSGGSLALFAVLAAVYFVEFSADPKSDMYGAISLALALGLRAWPLALVPVFLKNYSAGSERRRFAALSLLPPLLLWLPLLFKKFPVQYWFLELRQTGETGLLPAAEQLAEMVNVNFLVYMNGYAALSYFVLAVLGLYYFFGKLCFPLLPGLALATLTLLVFLPGASFDLMLGLLALSLLLPGALALRHGLFALGVGLLLAMWSRPTELFTASAQRFEFTGNWPWWLTVLWAGLNLGLWYFWTIEWWRLIKLCRRPARLRFI